MTAKGSAIELAARQMSEQQLQRAVIDACDTLGLLVFHVTDSRAAKVRRGWPDLAIVGKRLLIRELKTETGRVRPEQHLWISRLVRAGVDAGIWRPSSLLSGEIVQTLRGIR